MATGNRVLKDRYELLGLMATGGMGQVWRGRDLLLGRPVAVKVVRGGLTADASFLTRFRAEAQHAAMLNHPNIAAVHDYGEQTLEDGESLAFLVMELVEGESLAGLLQRTGRLDVPLTMSVVRQTAAALAAAHAAGVVHRDVKPGNVLVRPDGIVKITDFGIAWSAASAALTRTGQVVGTAHYLSPEQAAGGKASPASDVYALGAVAYECLAGRRAFEGESSVQIALMQIRDEPAPLPPDVPAPVRGLVGSMMVKDPALRIPDGAAVVAAVDDLGAAPATGAVGTATQRVPAGAVPVPARAPSGPQPTAVLPVALAGGALGAGDGVDDGDEAPGPRSRRRAGLVAAVLLLALAVVAALVAGLRSSTPPARSTAAPTTAAPTTSAAPATTAAGIPVDPAAFVGRPVDQVRARLTELGLVPKLAAVTTTSVAAGTVTAVTPSGSLAAGQEVAVSYAVAPSTAATPPPTTAAPTTPAGKPGKGHGKKDGGDDG